MSLVQGKAPLLISCLGLFFFLALVGCDDPTPSTPDAMVTDAFKGWDQAPKGDASADGALDLAEQGYQVVVVERLPTIGGAMIGLSNKPKNG